MQLNKRSKIFIAGHTGMVGSAIRRSLVNKGYTKLLCPSRKDLNLLTKHMNTFVIQIKGMKILIKIFKLMMII